ncbi:CSEP0001 putative effector protein [Blumeria hordei DH14]|uniref:CSEP0001 putative effector protein n=1 Tax=Blumeria graminis f. sp. hordei (strain DH14) TaxID=546991 RepID=N1JNS1_BLUG1|nr:CSEP0001 putative effector protein [Blumeria hordei DH14]
MLSRLSLLSILFGLFISESAASFACPSGNIFQDNEVEPRANEIYSQGINLDTERGQRSNYQGITFLGSRNSDYFAFEAPFSRPDISDRTYKINVQYPSRRFDLIEMTQRSSTKLESTCDNYYGYEV